VSSTIKLRQQNVDVLCFETTGRSGIHDRDRIAGKPAPPHTWDPQTQDIGRQCGGTHKQNKQTTQVSSTMKLRQQNVDVLCFETTGRSGIHDRDRIAGKRRPGFSLSPSLLTNPKERKTPPQGGSLFWYVFISETWRKRTLFKNTTR